MELPRTHSQARTTLQQNPIELTVRIREKTKMDAKKTLLQKNGTFKSGPFFREPKNCPFS